MKEPATALAIDNLIIIPAISLRREKKREFDLNVIIIIHKLGNKEDFTNNSNKNVKKSTNCWVTSSNCAKSSKQIN